MPERDWPDNFTAIVIDFVRLLVASMVGRFAGAGNNQDGRLGDKGVKTTLQIHLLTTQLRNFLPEFGLSHNDKRLALAKTGAGRVLSQVQDTLEGLRINCFRGEMTH